jgi:Prokaryotic N-terminal methylation motif
MRRRQKGFTLLELMMASTASMMILLPAFAILLRTGAAYGEMQSELALNRQLRQAFDIIGNGATLRVNGTDATPNVYGIRGRKLAPAGPLRANYQLQYQSNNLTVTGDAVASTTVTCVGAGTPLPDCASAGQSKNVAGWIGKDVSLNAASRSVANRTVEVSVTITDPFQSLRQPKPATATQTYRTLFTLNRQEADP